MADTRNSYVAAMADTAVARAYEIAEGLRLDHHEEGARRSAMVGSLSLNNIRDWPLMVRTFHAVYQMPIGDRLWKDNGLAHMSDDRIKMRLSLIAEEVVELVEACGQSIEIQPAYDDDAAEKHVVTIGPDEDSTRNTIEIADARGDIIYVVCGFAVEMGIDLTSVVREIHASNLTKLDANGQPIFRGDGKVMKGPNYMKPRIDLALGWLNHSKEQADG